MLLLTAVIAIEEDKILHFDLNFPDADPCCCCSSFSSFEYVIVFILFVTGKYEESSMAECCVTAKEK